VKDAALLWRIAHAHKPAVVAPDLEGQQPVHALLALRGEVQAIEALVTANADCR
jgi:hypothetical protein